MTTFKPYIAGSRRNGIGTGWRQREADAAARLEDRAAESQDEELRLKRAASAAMIEAYRLAQDAERVEQAKHAMIDLPRELAGHVQSGRARQSFHPYLIEAVERYLADFPQFRPRTLADAAPEPMSNDEIMARHYARHGLPVPTPAQKVLEIVEPEKRGRGRPPKRIETTEDGALFES